MIVQKLWRSGALIVFGLGLGLFLAEGFLRLVPSVVPFAIHSWIAQKPWLFTTPNPPQFLAEYRTLWEKDKVLRDRPKSNLDTVLHGNSEYPAWHIRTDALGLGLGGFRDTLPRREPYAIVLGDSFGFGVGVRQEEIWLERLERETGRPFVNLSRVGASSLHEALIYARASRQIPSKVVFWMFFQNDLKENLRFAQWQNPRAPMPLAIAQPTQVCSGRLHQFLRRYSVAYEPLLYWWRACEYSAIPFIPSYRDPTLSLVFCRDHDICNPEVQKRMITDGWPLTRQALYNTLAQTAQTGAKLVIIIVPSKEQVYWKQLQTVAPFPPGYPIDQLIEPLQAFCQQEQLSCLDLTEVFRTQAQTGVQLYFPVDIHWNVQGHALAAQAVGDYLRDAGLWEHKTDVR